MRPEQIPELVRLLTEGKPPSEPVNYDFEYEDDKSKHRVTLTTKVDSQVIQLRRTKSDGQIDAFYTLSPRKFNDVIFMVGVLSKSVLSEEQVSSLLDQILKQLSS